MSSRERRARLEQVYLDTVYRVSGPFCVLDLRIGVRSPALDRLLHRLGVRDWVFVTAWNPSSRAQPGWRNRARQARLARALRGLHICLPGLGLPRDSRWQPEHSLFAAPVSAGRARRLGRRFGQNAVVAGRRGQPPALLWTG